jgi:uncharacterized protein YegJ (DUF2314 family)
MRVVGLVAVVLALAACPKPSGEKPAAAEKPKALAPDASVKASGPRTVPLREKTVAFSYTLRLSAANAKGPELAKAALRKLAPTYLSGLPEAVALDGGEAPVPSFEVDGFSAVAIDPKEVAIFDRGLIAAHQARLAKPHELVSLEVHATGEQADAVLLGAVRLVEAVARDLDAVVDDVESRSFYSPAGFASSVVEGGFEGTLPVVPAHVTVQSYELEDGTLRSVTVGMGKLGLPNLAVSGHSRSHRRQVGQLINATAQALLEGAAPLPKGGVFELDAHALKAKKPREAILTDPKKGATGTARFSLVPGQLDEGDDPGPLLELTFGGEPGHESERLEACLTGLFGAQDSLKHVEHTSELLAVSARQKKKLLEQVKPRWLKHHAPGDTLLVKAPFKKPSGGSEWMWVEVTTWRRGVISGTLQNDPYEVTNLKAGARVEVKEDDVFDYLLTRADGSEEGNETAPLLEEQEDRQEE